MTHALFLSFFFLALLNSPSNDQAIPAKSSSGDAALHVLEVLGHSRELAFSPSTNVEPVGSQSTE